MYYLLSNYPTFPWAPAGSPSLDWPSPGWPSVGGQSGPWDWVGRSTGGLGSLTPTGWETAGSVVTHQLLSWTSVWDSVTQSGVWTRLGLSDSWRSGRQRDVLHTVWHRRTRTGPSYTDRLRYWEWLLLWFNPVLNMKYLWNIVRNNDYLFYLLLFNVKCCSTITFFLSMR